MAQPVTAHELSTSTPSSILQTTGSGKDKKDATNVAIEPSPHVVEQEVGMVELAEVGYERSLKRRQIMMMAFGAGIGTGLWVGTGTGPGGIAVSYTIMAWIVYIMYTSIGEMTADKLVHGGFTRQAGEYVDPALGFAIGINFWFNWVMIIPAEITACISVLHYWET
ncbi:Amino acid/polyamine transporter I [Macrophomina phaseolina MS6]|uniref:Amino acid/polyamine transporter I n=1 Tax=Macrophomina phaseolina (strain MS6) TaxID=1126212 RepID=K2SH16_MACPH|nr:Amino acid/polyamine transporter I [Macrophomina phaseolina MS6]